VGANTLRALADHEAGPIAAPGTLLRLADPERVPQLIAHNRRNPDQKVANPAHDMPDDMIKAFWGHGNLKARGPHAPKTVLRRLSNWSTLHQWKRSKPRAMNQA
jgi:hypothetical protein